MQLDDLEQDASDSETDTSADYDDDQSEVDYDDQSYADDTISEAEFTVVRCSSICIALLIALKMNGSIALLSWMASGIRSDIYWLYGTMSAWHIK